MGDFFRSEVVILFPERRFYANRREAILTFRQKGQPRAQFYWIACYLMRSVSASVARRDLIKASKVVSNLSRIPILSEIKRVEPTGFESEMKRVNSAREKSWLVGARVFVRPFYTAMTIFQMM